ncbi:hypothetical protein RFI_15638, partial [Reticulomyxa filosa]
EDNNDAENKEKIANATGLKLDFQNDIAQQLAGTDRSNEKVDNGNSTVNTQANENAKIDPPALVGIAPELVEEMTRASTQHNTKTSPGERSFRRSKTFSHNNKTLKNQNKSSTDHTAVANGGTEQQPQLQAMTSTPSPQGRSKPSGSLNSPVNSAHKTHLGPDAFRWLPESTARLRNEFLSDNSNGAAARWRMSSHRDPSASISRKMSIVKEVADDLTEKIAPIGLKATMRALQFFQPSLSCVSSVLILFFFCPPPPHSTHRDIDEHIDKVHNVLSVSGFTVKT